MHVEDHHDDLGDDLSGPGDDLTFLTADITPTDWTDDEGDHDAETIVHQWTKPGLYLPCFQETKKKIQTKEIEFAEIEANGYWSPIRCLTPGSCNGATYSSRGAIDGSFSWIAGVS